MSNSFYREIINEHNLHPIHKRILPRAGLSRRGVNPSCGDDITLQLTIEDGVIKEGAYSGNGCAETPLGHLLQNDKRQSY